QRPCQALVCTRSSSRSLRARSALLGSPPAQPRLHERFEVAVENGLDVARLVLGPFVLDLLIGSQHIATDEQPGPAHLALRPADGGQLGPPFLPLTLGELGRQDLKGLRLFLVLASLVLDGHHY